MEGATHFIEVYKTGNGSELSTSAITNIESLERSIALTKKFENAKTIAVWNIKLKAKEYDFTIHKRMG